MSKREWLFTNEAKSVGWVCRRSVNLEGGRGVGGGGISQFIVTLKIDYSNIVQPGMSKTFAYFNVSRLIVVENNVERANTKEKRIYLHNATHFKKVL